MKERYHVTGMSCSACSSHVEKAVNKLENVEKASVNLLTETMDVTYDETKITSAEIIDAVVKAGYGASVMTEGSVAGVGGQSTSGNAGSTGKSTADGKQELQQKLDADARAMKWRLGISIGFLIPLMYVSMHHMLKEWFGIPVPAFIVNTMHGNANAMNFALNAVFTVIADSVCEPEVFLCRIQNIGAPQSEHGQPDRSGIRRGTGVRHFRHVPDQSRPGLW